MDNMEIGSLELRIQASATNARKSINELKSSLRSLQTTAGKNKGLDSVSRSLSNLSTSIASLNTGAIRRIKDFSAAIASLSSLNGVKISSTLAKQINSLGNAVRGLDGIKAKSVSNLVNGLKPLATMPKSNLSGTVNALKKLPDVLAGLDALDMDRFAQKIQEVTAALAPLASQMATVSAGFAKFPMHIQRAINASAKFPDTIKHSSLSLVNFAIRLKMAIYSIRWFVSGIAKTIKNTNDYIENLNLFNASMGKFTEEARDYAEQVADIMGTDPGVWMRNQGVFMTLATGFGVAGERAAFMSKNLTQLGYDLSSFFNLPVADAMQKLQSGISGELEPLELAA